MSVKIYSAYKRPPSVGVEFTMPTMAQQQFRDESDINWIMQRFAKTGVLPNVDRPYYYGDGSPVDYQQALDTVIEAEEQFLTFPSSIRDRFHNDPQRLLEFLTDPGNQEEAVRLGIANPARVNPEQNVDNSTKQETTSNLGDTNPAK